MSGLFRFRVFKKHKDAAIGNVREAGFEPFLVESPDNEAAVEFRGVTLDQERALVSAFLPEYAATVGAVGGSPLANKAIQ